VPNGLIIQRWNQNAAVWRKVAFGDRNILVVHQNNYDRWQTSDEKWQRPIRIVLTIAHLDHDTTNNEMSNLAALCQRCHLRYDARLHAESAMRTRRTQQPKTHRRNR
jgi:5-methylcytosine-specific restriction endonuclease McrA